MIHADKPLSPSEIANAQTHLSQRAATLVSCFVSARPAEQLGLLVFLARECGYTITPSPEKP